MPKCPKCRYVFQVPDGDSPEEHGCYRCGYGTEPEPEPEGPTCVYCGEPINPLFADENDNYCSSLCACYADKDNEEDRP